MPYVTTNRLRLSYRRSGQGEPVLFIMGSSSAGHVWDLHQTPAAVRAGYEAVTLDNRGIWPSDVPPGRYTLDDMVADTIGLIEQLSLAPCRIVATSLGAMITQELAASHPHLVRGAVLIATRARSDVFRAALTGADRALAEGDVKLPAAYASVMTALQMLSPSTLRDDAVVKPLLEVFELARVGKAAGQAWVDRADDRRHVLARIQAPCRVIGFADDLITPPHLVAEVAELIPGADYVEIGEAGHLGYLERPEEVNEAILGFLAKV